MSSTTLTISIGVVPPRRRLILAHDPSGGFASYELDADQLDELRRPASELVRALSAVN
jgi:hypothetical protein